MYALRGLANKRFAQRNFEVSHLLELYYIIRVP